jgi:hypothetical protein
VALVGHSEERVRTTKMPGLRIKLSRFVRVFPLQNIRLATWRALNQTRITGRHDYPSSKQRPNGLASLRMCLSAGIAHLELLA